MDKRKDKENQENEKNEIDEEHQEYEEEENEDDRKDDTESSDECVSDYETATSDIDCDTDIETEDLADKFSNLNCEPAELEVQSEDGNMHNVDDILAPISDEEDKDALEQISECEDEFEDECDNDSDWITPSKFLNFSSRYYKRKKYIIINIVLHKYINVSR